MSALQAPRAIKLKLTSSLLGAALLALTAGTALAQTPAAPAPGTQKPTAPAPPTPPAAAPAPPPPAPAAQAPPASPATPPKPFPEGAKIAYVNVQAIASNWNAGKAATSKLDELRKKKARSLAEKNEALQAGRTELQQGATVLSRAGHAGPSRPI